MITYFGMGPPSFWRGSTWEDENGDKMEGYY